MPELPEVETVARGLAPHVRGRRIISVTRSDKALRLPWPDDFAARLEGARIKAIARRAKFLLWRLEGGMSLLSHLGMSGRFTVLPGGGGKTRGLGEFYFHPAAAPEPGPHDHLTLVLDDQTRVIYTDPRRFGFFDLLATEAEGRHPMLARLGPEPLGPQFTAAHLAAACQGRRAPIKSVLLDQKTVAGLGNIYVCEALFRARISPKRTAASLSPSGRAAGRIGRLVAQIRAVLREAIAAGGSTLRDHARVSGEAGGFQQHFSVYGRAGEPCEACGRPVRRITQSGRSSFYCSACQR